MTDDPRFLIKQDALLQFARLIGNDLAIFEWKEVHVDHMYFSGYRVSLSDKGQHLIEAWRKGDRNAVAEALSPSSPLEMQPTAT